MSRIIVLLAVSVASLQAVHFPNSWRYAHPDAQMLAGVDVHELMKSPVGQVIRDQVAKAGLSGIPGVEIINDIDRIFISSPGKPEGTAEAPMLALLTGRFRLDWLRKLAASEGATIRTYSTVEIIAPPKAHELDPHFALIDATTILVGDRKTVIAALERGGTQASQPPEADSVMGRAREMADRHHVWIVSTLRLDQFAGNRAPQLPFAADIEAVEAGLSFREGARVDLRLVTKSEESAKSIATGLQMLVPLALQQQPAMAELAKKIEVAVGETEVRLALAIDAKDLEQSFGQLQASFTPPGSHSQLPAPTAVDTPRAPVQVQPPPPPRKRVIRIEGLDEGPREIPFP
jgi:hypothetical protein